MKFELTNKAVIYITFGGFIIPKNVKALFTKKIGKDIDDYEIPRNSKILVECFKKINTDEAFLIVPINKNKIYTIYEYDGYEWITEHHKYFDRKLMKWKYSSTDKNIYAIMGSL